MRRTTSRTCIRRTLASLIDRRRVMTPREIARMMTQVVEGLEALLKAKGR